MAVQAMLAGMPVASDLGRSEVDGRVVINVGATVLFDYSASDVGMRKVAAVTLPELGFTARRVAEVLGITEEYVSMLRARARRDGSAALTDRRGRPRTLGPAGPSPGHGVGVPMGSPTVRSAGVSGFMAAPWLGR